MEPTDGNGNGNGNGSALSETARKWFFLTFLEIKNPDSKRFAQV
jgi:hypothetical protein